MTKFDYNRAIDTATRLIDKFGQLGSLRIDGAVIPNVTFAVTDYSFDDFRTGMIATGDRRVYLEPHHGEPIPNRDLLFIGALAHKIIPPVRKLDPAGIVVFYELQVRR